MSPYVGRKAELKRNLRKVYRRANRGDKHAGRIWYRRAYTLVRLWAKKYDLPPATVAAVIAALSPQTDWQSNIRAAYRVLNYESLSGIGTTTQANIDKARRILLNRSTDTRDYYKAGPKVYNFSRNLQGDSDAVTVDGHALQAAEANPLVKKGPHEAAYRAVADAYRETARELGEEPADFQAIVWVTWKRLNPTAAKQRLR